MGRVCGRVSHKSCLIHFDLSVSIEQCIASVKTRVFLQIGDWHHTSDKSQVPCYSRLNLIFQEKNKLQCFLFSRLN